MISVPQKVIVSIAAIASWLVFVPGSRLHAQSTQREVKSILDGVFTSEQSARGEAQYLESCKRCHKRDLNGDEGEEVPPLVGDKFLSEWSKWTVGDLFEFFTTKMPPKRKHRLKLSAEKYADILAYILEQNGFPAGETELPPTLEFLLEIEMSPAK